MEFNEKLQELRKHKGMTQEELARVLYVSRTAVSKWESGRGYPNIESLKRISEFFSVTVDELLSCEEVLVIAKEDEKQKGKHLRELLLGLLDLCAVLLAFLPFFAVRADGAVSVCSLLSLDGVALYLKISYLAVVIGIAAAGILMLALQSFQAALLSNLCVAVSLALSIAAVILFTASLQPYAAIFAFALLAIKVLLTLKLH